MGFAFKDKNSYGTTAGERNLLVNQMKMSLWRPPASLEDEVVLKLFSITQQKIVAFALPQNTSLLFVDLWCEFVMVQIRCLAELSLTIYHSSLSTPFIFVH